MRHRPLVHGPIGNLIGHAIARGMNPAEGTGDLADITAEEYLAAHGYIPAGHLIAWINDMPHVVTETEWDDIHGDKCPTCGQFDWDHAPNMTCPA